ncbi:MAG: AAA family ATPase [Candidatus Pacearchaeota archaeon]|nr:AAA family ATPase [Candidatus Pacearchaeota archaeon]
MIIERIKLKNIRSFEEQEITFPKGKILLAGDIGSGKSSVLLALEFALFGLQTGFVSGAGLLRKGANIGEVEVELKIQNKKIKIKRALRRKKNSISQDKGFLETENSKEQLSPEELKAKILKFLNYPSSLLKAKSNLLFRFTVYTPQEQMRQILTEKPEERINTLRRIFGIDKYKNVETNLEIFLTKLKEQIKILEVHVEDINEIKEELEKQKKAMEEEKKEIEKVDFNLKSILTEIKQKEELIRKFEEQIKVLHYLKAENSSIRAEYGSIIENLKEIKKQIEKIGELPNIKLEEKNFREENNWKLILKKCNTF